MQSVALELEPDAAADLKSAGGHIGCLGVGDVELDSSMAISDETARADIGGEGVSHYLPPMLKPQRRIAELD